MRGHIVTNQHVHRQRRFDPRASSPTAGWRARASWPRSDTDLAVLKIDLHALPVAIFGRSDQLRVGDLVLAIGNPIGLSQTVTHGS